jgi:arabinan endo-1,5-alpha-L-arabinosidase
MVFRVIHKLSLLAVLSRMRRGFTVLNITPSLHSSALSFLVVMGLSSLVTLTLSLPLLLGSGLSSPLPQGDTSYYRSSYPDPSPCVGNCSHIHDPSIIYEDGTYWRFSTSGNIAMASAPSLKGPWTYRGSLLQEGTKIHVAPDQDIWVITLNLVLNKD